MAHVLDISFLTFVYPFSFNPNDFGELVKNVENAKLITKKTEQEFWLDDGEKGFPHSDLLPHISSYLKNNQEKEPTARLWKISSPAFTSPNGLGSQGDWYYTFQHNHQEVEVPFTFENVQIYLFRAGIGMLTLEVKPQTDSLELWQNFLHFFRYLGRDEKLTARKKSGKDSWEKFFPNFGNEESNKKDEYGNLSKIVYGLLKTIKKNKWWEDVFIHNQMMPYTALFISDYPAQNDYQLCYKLRNFFHTKQGENPAPTDLLPNHSSLVEYSERQWFIFALDGGNFLAFDPPNTTFFRETLPDHIRKQYFQLYIIALHQRFALMDMSHDVAEHWWAKNEDERMNAFERIRDRFLFFTARGYFAQVMQREHHHRNYRKWQEIFDLNQLYNEVRDEVREMFDWLQLRQSKHLEQIAKEQSELAKQESKEAARREKEAKELADELAKKEIQREKENKERIEQFERRLSIFALLIALGIGIPALVVGFFGMNISDMPESINLTFRNAVFILFTTIIICVLIAVLIYLYINKETQPTQKNDE